MKKTKLSEGGIVVALCCAVYFISYLARLDYSAVMAEMIARNVLDKEGAGLIGTALFFAYGAGQLVSGYLGDKIKPQYIICCGLLLSAVCNALMPFFETVAALAVIWSVNGLAQAMLWPPIVKIMSGSLREEQYAKGVFWVSTASHLATICVYLVVPLVIAVSGWKSVFWYAGGAAFAVLILFAAGYCRIKETSVSMPTPTEEKKTDSLKNAFLSSGLILILIAIVLQGILRDGITSWMPTYMTEVFGMSAALSILLNVLLPVFSWGCILVAGFLYKKVFKNEILQSIFFFALAFLFSVIFLLGKDNEIVALASAALITGCMHAINLTLICYVPMRYKNTGKVSLVSGITNAFTYVGSTISSYGFAAVSVSYGWECLAYIWIGAGVLGVVILAFGLRLWKKFIENNK